MSWTYFGDTNPKARKSYYCALCERAIEKGEVHVARRGVGDDGPCTTRMHNACKVVTESWTQDDWEYQDPFEFRRELEHEGEK